MVKSKISVFLDTSVVVSGLRSDKGASSYILSLCRQKKVKGVISDLVVREAVVNLKTKIGTDAVIEFYKLLTDDSLIVVVIEKEAELKDYELVTHSKDIHVLAAAKKAEVDFLISLDRRHIVTTKVAKKLFPIRVILPGDFLKKYFPKIRK